nr:uncharacterized protein LOC109169483 [Ipomoea batatas]
MEYMMQPYEEECKENMRNKILAMLEELKQDITHMRQECKQEIMQEFATQRQEISSLWQETQASIRNLEDQITQVVMWENEWENTYVEERNVGNGVVEKEIKEESGEDDEDVQIVCGDELYFGKTLEAQCEVVDMTSDINCTIEDVEDVFVEPSSDEIGVKKHDDFCNDPSVDFRDDDSRDACIENVIVDMIDHQDYLYYDHYEDMEYMMQPYEEECKENMRNKILAMLEELKQDITHMRQECKQEIMQEFATQRQEISSLWQETQASIRNLEDQITQVVMWENEWENTYVEERNVGNGVVEKEIKEESGEDDEDVQIVCGDELYFGKTLEAQCEVVDMTSDINCTIEDVEDVFVEPSSDEIGVKKHDDFCNDPSVDFRDDDSRDACIENVIVDMIGEDVDDELFLSPIGLRRIPFEEMASSAQCSCLIPTTKEEASLLWSRLPNHAFAALHSIETVRVRMGRTIGDRGGASTQKTHW